MSELPQGWINAEFGKLNQFSSKNIDPSEYPDEVFELYSVPIFPTGKPELSLGKDIGSTKQQVQPGDVLVCKINPRINRVWVVGEKTKFRQIASSEWIVMRAERHDPRFLGRYFSSSEFRELLCTDLTGVGGSLTRAQPKRVATYEIPIAPRAEQKRIADKLDALLARVDATRERLDRIPALLKRFRQSVLAAATAGQLTEDWRQEQSTKASVQPVAQVQQRSDIEQSPPKGQVEPISARRVSSRGLASSNCDQRRAHKTPSDLYKPHPWEVLSMGDVIDDLKYGTSKKCSYESIGLPVLRIPNIGNGFISRDDLKYAEFDEKERRSLALKRGDLLLIRSNGSLELVGKVALVSKDEEDYLYAGYLIRLRVRKSLVIPKFVSIWISSPRVRDYIELTARSTSGVNNLNSEEIRSIPIAVPSLEEQKEIVRRLESLFILADKLEAHYNAARSQVDKLTPALLAKAFRGELVPQDPDDEPIDKFLERAAVPRMAKTIRARKKAGEAV